MMKRRARKKPGIDLGVFGWRPKLLTEGAFLGAGVLVICLFAGAGLMDRYIKEGGSQQFAAVIAAVLVDLANEDREANALGALQVNPKLVAAAQAKANDMAAKGYFAHKTPEGLDSWHWFRESGYDYAYAGENLAVNFSESADVQKAWMASPTHRENVLNDRYSEIGIATAAGTYNGKPAIFAVQMFGRPSSAELNSRVPVEATAAAPTPRATTVVPSSGATLGETTVLDADEISWWQKLIVQPKEFLRVAYYIIGLLLLAALFFDMELEMKWHHVRHARKVGYLLATMSMLFIAADWVFFAEPTLAAISSIATMVQ